MVQQLLFAAQKQGSDTRVIPNKTHRVFWSKSHRKSQQKTCTKLSSISVCHASNN